MNCFHFVEKLLTTALVCYTVAHLSNSDGEFLKSSSDCAFVLDQLSYKCPVSEEQLVEELSLRICQGTHLLVVGNTGTGKTSLLRVLNRLWEPSNGERNGVAGLEKELIVRCVFSDVC